MTGAIPPHLDIAAMDATHEEAYSLLAELDDCPDSIFPTLFDRFVNHTRNHFEHENRVMEDCMFGAIQEHLNEHGRMMGDLTHLAAALKKGRLDYVRSYMTESFRETLDGHIRSADKLLADALRDPENKVKTA